MHSLVAANALGTVLGAIERALGSVLAAIYSVTHSYPLAIILLTVGVRALLIPLTAKSFKSMSAMQTIQPEMKKVQQKYKQLQQKANDRMEVQQLRMQMNQEMQALYKAHGVNPLGSCVPTLGQFPVLIAMFAIMRASIFAIPTTVTPTPSFPAATAKNIICRPVDDAGNYIASQPTGPTPTKVRCADSTGAALSGETVFTISDLHEGRAGDGPLVTDGAWITQCRPTGDAIQAAASPSPSPSSSTPSPSASASPAPATGKKPFICHSAVGSGQLPRNSKLFADVTKDKASIFGMHPGCTPLQVSSPSRVKECLATGTGGASRAIPYFAIVLLIIGSQFYMSKQMMARASGPQLQQQQMMTRIMPLFLGYISLNIPAGANLYFLVQNVWTIGQQQILLNKAPTPAAGAKPAGDKPAKATPALEAEKPAPKQPQQGSKKRKKRKKR